MVRADIKPGPVEPPRNCKAQRKYTCLASTLKVEKQAVQSQIASRTGLGHTLSGYNRRWSIDTQHGIYPARRVHYALFQQILGG